VLLQKLKTDISKMGFSIKDAIRILEKLEQTNNSDTDLDLEYSRRENE
jgi:hypothetical protein